MPHAGTAPAAFDAAAVLMEERRPCGTITPPDRRVCGPLVDGRAPLSRRAAFFCRRGVRCPSVSAPLTARALPRAVRAARLCSGCKGFAAPISPQAPLLAVRRRAHAPRAVVSCRFWCGGVKVCFAVLRAALLRGRAVCFLGGLPWPCVPRGGSPAAPRVRRGRLGGAAVSFAVAAACRLSVRAACVLACGRLRLSLGLLFS